MKKMMLVVSVLVWIAVFAQARDLLPNKTHAVLTVTYTNFNDVPMAKKKLVFVGQKNEKKKVSVVTDEEGEATSIIRAKIPIRFIAKASRACSNVAIRPMFR